MTAMNQEQARRYSEVDPHNPILFGLQKGGTTIYKNAVAVKLNGKAQPAVANTAGQTLLGFSELTYVAGTSDTTWSQPQMVFQQRVGALANDANDPVVAADVGSDVYLSDDNTVHHTNAGNDVAVRCKWIEPDGTIMCEVKNP
jgi:hypothetical protein